MYNKEILKELIRRYGVEKTIIFCEMESVRNSLLQLTTKEEDGPTEFEFERNWWKENGEELKHTRIAKALNLNYEHDRTTRKV
jgi:hypothetical protein